MNPERCGDCAHEAKCRQLFEDTFNEDGACMYEPSTFRERLRAEPDFDGEPIAPSDESLAPHRASSSRASIFAIAAMLLAVFAAVAVVLVVASRTQKTNRIILEALEGMQ